jgi:Ca2+-binding EF-hand superfamily protein
MKKLILVLISIISISTNSFAVELKTITKKEYLDNNIKRLEQEFDTVDTNKDGKVTPEEQKAYKAKIDEARKIDQELGKLADTNKDGKVSKEEREKILIAMDTNKDGYVTLQEQKDYLKKNNSKK